jgi:F1F0 ATPase subunit 2
MTMIDALGLALTFLIGSMLGAIFFGGLWWTIQRGLDPKRSTAWFIGSALVRTCIVLAGFFFVARGSWMRILACLIGFSIARLVVMRVTRAQKKPTYRIS